VCQNLTDIKIENDDIFLHDTQIEVLRVSLVIQSAIKSIDGESLQITSTVPLKILLYLILQKLTKRIKIFTAGLTGQDKTGLGPYLFSLIDFKKFIYCTLSIYDSDFKF